MLTAIRPKTRTLFRPIMIGYDHEYTDSVIVRMPQSMFAMTQAYTGFTVEALPEDVQQGLINSPQHARMKALLAEQFPHA